eukprot:TRINITY_DN26070_c0_g1_i1.p1 TRINITY_DN26070_c0_g1~~TRINITY_DN26070_c0_g1_i1.p1  ORF type:complete len:794 (-),score=129.52 TRINITY_DN26070_c0_g1_i1:49-2430(-)
MEQFFPRAALMLCYLPLAIATTSPHISASVDEHSGAYAVRVDGVVWYQSPASSTACIAGKQLPLNFKALSKASGHDKFGPWQAVTASFSAGTTLTTLDYSFKQYSDRPYLIVATASFPDGLDTAGCGQNTALITHFPSFNTSAAMAPDLHTLSWRGVAVKTTAAAKGLAALGANGLDCGPVVSREPTAGKTLVWSTLDAHKIVPQMTHGDIYAMGLSGAIPSVPRGYSYSVMLSVSSGGATAGMYTWGNLIRNYYGTYRIPSVTLSHVGYYTDDGAYYYVWEAFGIPARPWPAEEGLVLVKEALYKMGVPVAYMQLDDWWYNGRFFFGNVKAVEDWNASSSPRLFPHGLKAFADKLNLPLQLYVPFWSDKYQSKYHMTESTAFPGTKLVTPNDSYDFFADIFDQGKDMTNGRFSTFEIDFLDKNFQGSSSMMEDTGAADRWYAGLAGAALERNISVQFCLPSSTDMLVSLAFPAVVQARASDDYVSTVTNVAQLAGSSLLMGAVDIAPSKDTLWTASPQPATSSDTMHSGYTTQPHVQLDVVLATLSLGPVGISDGLNQTDAGLIKQAFRSAADGTLLRPSRPLSAVDAVFTNRSLGKQAADVRSTHAAVSSNRETTAVSVSHYVVAWRTTEDVMLQATDLYPEPVMGPLAVRKHVLEPTGSAQVAGCEAGADASSCIDILAPGKMPNIPATGGGLSHFSLTAVYEPMPNGAYFLGELQKLVHVSPQRFTHVLAEGKGPCGLTVGVLGSPGELVELVAVDPQSRVHVSNVRIPTSGFAEVVMGEEGSTLQVYT